MGGAVRGRAGSLITRLIAIAAIALALLLTSSMCSAGIRWAANGVAICTNAGDQEQPQVVSDGAGGAIITWQDNRSGNSDIYAQRVLHDGTTAPGWPVDGVAVCTASGIQFDSQITTDGLSGAIITWQDNRSGNSDIYAQRVLHDGTTAPGWPVDGAPICAAASDQIRPQITSGGLSGAVITWEDDRNHALTRHDIYAQRVLSDGTIAAGWPVDGVAICTANDWQQYPQMTSDGFSGAIITWEDYRHGFPTSWSIYAQRVLSDGTIAAGWPVDGVPVCTVDGYQYQPQITSDGAAGAIITWHDRRDWVQYDIYAQRVLHDGTIAPGWTVNGVAICTGPGTEDTPQITTDGAGGAIITWEDQRSGNYDIYAQRVDQAGAVIWTADGVPVCTEAGDQRLQEIASDGVGGAIITWRDGRSGNGDIYAQRVSNAAPTVAGINPGQGNNNEVVNVNDLSGTGFLSIGGAPDARLRMAGEPDIVATSVTVVSPTQISCDLDLDGAEVGTWDAYVENPDGQSATLTGAFDVQWPSPHVTSIDPDHGNVGETLDDVSISGDCFRNVATTVELRRGVETIVGTDVSFLSDKRITCDFDLEGAAVANDWDVFVRHDDDGKSDNLTEGFQVREVALEAVKGQTMERPCPGGFLNYIIYIQNRGNGDARDVRFTDQIPNRTTVVEGSVICSDGGATVTSEDPVVVRGITIGAGRTVTVAFQVTVEREVPVGAVIENQGFLDYLGEEYRTSSADNPGSGDPTEVVVEKALGSTDWFMAEGSTGAGFDTYILLQNPGTSPAETTVFFSTEEGPGDPILMVLAPESRTNVRIADYLPGEYSVSTLVQSSRPIVAERSMYWDSTEPSETHPCGLAPYEMRSGHANLGVPLEQVGLERGASSRGLNSHYFPEGSTAGGFDTWILLVNPNSCGAEASVTLMDGSGEAVRRNVTVGALSRRTVHVDELLPDAEEVATEVTCDRPLVAERSMYWDPKAAIMNAYQMTGGHSTAGSPSTSRNWYLAEGSTGGGFETYVLLQNPTTQQASVDVTFLTDAGVADRTSTAMPPRSRATIKVSDHVPDDFQVSTVVSSDVPVVAERSMYWDAREAVEPFAMKDGHSCVGETETSTTWMVPEGSSGGGFESFVLITNAGSADAELKLTFMTEGGPCEAVGITLGAYSRYTLWISDYVPDSYRVSTLVESENELVVERAMYWDRRESSPDGDFPARPFEMIGGHSANGLDP